MTDDIPDPSQDALLGVVPPGGTIFTQLTSHGISWRDYWEQYPSQISATPNLYPADDSALLQVHGKPMSQFFADAADGALPSFSLVEPNYGTQSQENPQNMVRGESFLRSVVEAVGGSPKWKQTALIITWDEHGGYYDHVPPPVALAPDAIAPVVGKPGESTYDGFKRYGFRVPAFVVSPYAKPRHVSHVVHDHTSILAFLERKWNLPAMTLRDANANDLTDFFDLTALASKRPTFPRLPKLAASGESSRTLMCSRTGPGTIPPQSPPGHQRIEIRSAAASRRRRGVVVHLRTNRGYETGILVELRRPDGRVLSRRRLPRLGSRGSELVLRSHGHLPAKGHYQVLVLHDGHRLAHRRVFVP